MLATKRYEYLAFEKIQLHPDIQNHRPLSSAKIAHYQEDILKNGLLEPLVVWEKRPGDYFLVGGFHRLAAIRAIRSHHPGYFDNVDVRVVVGDADEIKALNLKLNTDRVDTTIADYFDVVIYLNNVNWGDERIAAFLDKPVALIADIIRYVPSMDPRIRALIEAQQISWNKARLMCRAVQNAPAGQEHAVLDQQLAALHTQGAPATSKRPLTFKKAKARLKACIKKNPEVKFSVDGDDLFSLLLVLEGKQHEDEHLARVRETFPGLLEG